MPPARAGEVGSKRAACATCALVSPALQSGSPSPPVITRDRANRNGLLVQCERPRLHAVVGDVIVGQISKTLIAPVLAPGVGELQQLLLVIVTDDDHCMPTEYLGPFGRNRHYSRLGRFGVHQLVKYG